MTVIVAVLPAVSVAWARSDTNPGPAGLVTWTARLPAAPMTLAGCQVCPSSVENSAVRSRLGCAAEFACRPPGMDHGPWRSEGGALLFEVRYFAR